MRRYIKEENRTDFQTLHEEKNISISIRPDFYSLSLKNSVGTILGETCQKENLWLMLTFITHCVCFLFRAAQDRWIIHLCIERLVNGIYMLQIRESYIN